jgi:hypothetical protein
LLESTIIALLPGRTLFAAIESYSVLTEKMFGHGQKQRYGESPTNNQPDANTTPPKRSIYFKVPLLMTASLLIGTLLAIGQHLFFKSLDGHPIPDQGRQAWNYRFSLAFTFLVKTFLSTAISIACVQNIWWLLRSRSTSLETVDSVYGVLGSALKLADFRIWIFGPTVAILACGVWYVMFICKDEINFQLQPG